MIPPDLFLELEKFVSRETINNFEKYFLLLREWNRRSFLVQEKTLSEFWERHILDSLQLMPFLSLEDKILDLGTGGGFPGLVLALSGFSNLHLCEVNYKKAVFLSQVLRETNSAAQIINDRFENITHKDFTVVISRATTQLPTLLETSYNVSRETSVCCLFHKGKTYREEIAEARKKFDFSYEVHPSITSLDGVILKIHHIKKR